MTMLNSMSLMGRFFPSERWQKPVPDVSVGDRFEQQDEGVSVWIVERISQVRMSPFPLVSLARIGHPDITKTVSLTALLEQNDYKAAA